jgi:hypothetical protein
VTIVINEFEVVPQEAAPETPRTPADGQPRAALSAPEMEAVLSHLTERALRVWAH